MSRGLLLQSTSQKEKAVWSGFIPSLIYVRMPTFSDSQI